MRVFYKEASVVSEITKNVTSFKSDAYTASIATTDALYIASDFPFNHFFVQMGDTSNAISSVMSISYWSNQGWAPVVNINDYTNALTESGHVDFTPDRQAPWTRQDTSSSGQLVEDLESIVVYDKYWVKVTFSATLTNSIDIQWMGNIFSCDDDLFSEYPIFNDSSIRTGFEEGKYDWQEQHAKAAELIIQDLKRKNIIIGAEQILDKSILAPASVCKVAEIIFNAFGRDYNDQRLSAKEEYSKRIDLSRFVIDNNGDAIPDASERRSTQGWLSR